MNSKDMIWEQCKKVFIAFDDNKYDNLLKDIVDIIKMNYKVFKKVADLDFLEFIIVMDCNDYFHGTCCDDFEVIVKNYITIDVKDLKEIWSILKQLVWDLTVPVTDKVCSCGCDNIGLLTNKDESKIYEYCATCLNVWSDELVENRSLSLYPAKKSIVETKGYKLYVDVEKCVANVLTNKIQIEWMRYSMFHFQRKYNNIPMLVFRVRETSSEDAIERLKNCIAGFKGNIEWKVFKDPLSRNGNYLLTLSCLEKIRREYKEKREEYNEEYYFGVEKYRRYCDGAIQDIPLLAEYIDKNMMRKFT